MKTFHVYIPETDEMNCLSPAKQKWKQWEKYTPHTYQYIGLLTCSFTLWETSSFSHILLASAMASAQ